MDLPINQAEATLDLSGADRLGRHPPRGLRACEAHRTGPHAHRAGQKIEHFLTLSHTQLAPPRAVERFEIEGHHQRTTVATAVSGLVVDPPLAEDLCLREERLFEVPTEHPTPTTRRDAQSLGLGRTRPLQSSSRHRAIVQTPTADDQFGAEIATPCYIAPMSSGRPAAQPPESEPMAFLSDIHGNLAALEAVLAELETRDIRKVFVAGDILFGGDRSLEVWHRLQRIGARCVRGLSDTALCLIDPTSLNPNSDHERTMAQRFADTRRALGDLVIERIRRLPETLRIPLIDGREIVLVHGSPSDPSESLSHDMSDDEMLALVGDDPADIVVCGGSHVPFERSLPDLHIVNVGSVGAAPSRRTAHYAVLTPRMDGLLVEQLHIELDP